MSHNYFTTDTKPARKAILIVMGGLPGTGKTSLSKVLSLRLDAVYLRIDTIEQALHRQAAFKNGNEGYLVANMVAEDNLRLGHVVIADSVNPISITRDAWREIARRCQVDILEIEVVCSNKKQHRRRVEERKADIPEYKLPTWDEVVNRQYDAWKTKNLTIDTSELSVTEAVEQILKTYQLALKPNSANITERQP